MYAGNDIMILTSDGTVLRAGYDDLEYPYFYTDIDMKNENSVVRSEQVKVQYFTGKEYIKRDMYKISVKGAYEIPKLRKKSLVLAESDVPFLERRLGADGIIEYAETPLRYSYIDIEESGEDILLIGVQSIINGVKGEYIPFKSVKDFIKYLGDNHITMILAWNGEAYDYKRLDEEISKLRNEMYSYTFWWDIVLKLDAMKLYARYMQKNLMSLEKAGKEEGLGGKKELTKSLFQKPISEYTAEDWEELIEYNKRDVELLMNIVESTGILNINMRIAKETGCSIKDVSAVRMLDNLLLKKFHGTGIVLADNYHREKKEYEGAIVAGFGNGGIFENVIVFDINSLYPTVILERDFKGEYEETYNIIREFVRFFISERKRFKELYNKTKKREYNVTQQMYKIFANSIYGATANTSFRFFNSDIADFIAAEGRKVNVKLRDVIEKLGFQVLYTDTDSSFIQGINKINGDKLEKIINKEIYPFEVKKEKIFKKLLFLSGETGQLVKKRYAGIDEKGELVVKGLEIVRGDWAELAKEAEETVLYMLLRDNKSIADVKKYLDEMIRDIRKVSLEKLIFSKVIDTEREYKNQPRHLKVFEQLYPKGAGKRKLVFVRYFMGPKNMPIAVPENAVLENYRNFIDYDWYIKMQLLNPIMRIINSVYNGQKRLEEFAVI